VQNWHADTVAETGKGGLQEDECVHPGEQDGDDNARDEIGGQGRGTTMRYPRGGDWT
jgi:hypothetical protein